MKAILLTRAGEFQEVVTLVSRNADNPLQVNILREDGTAHTALLAMLIPDLPEARRAADIVGELRATARRAQAIYDEARFKLRHQLSITQHQVADLPVEGARA